MDPIKLAGAGRDGKHGCSVLETCILSFWGILSCSGREDSLRYLPQLCAWTSVPSPQTSIQDLFSSPKCIQGYVPGSTSLEQPNTEKKGVTL